MGNPMAAAKKKALEILGPIVGECTYHGVNSPFMGEDCCSSYIPDSTYECRATPDDIQQIIMAAWTFDD